MASDKQGARTRAEAARAVDAVVHSGRSLDAALEDADRRLPSGERPLAHLLAYDCLRQYWLLDAWIDALLDRPLKRRDRIVRALLAIGLLQLTGTRVPDHAAVSQTVEAARLLRRPKHAGLINAILRRFLRERDGIEIPDTPSLRYNHPEWLIERIRADWPDDWQAILDANNERAPMWLRVNAARLDRNAYRARLEACDIAASIAPGFDDALCLDAPSATDALPGFDDGDVSVQDAAAQLAAPWLLAHAPRRVLDACAAPGGKTAHIAERGGPDVDLTALDIDADRLSRVHATLARLGLAATILEGDASKPEDWWDAQPFDAILLDAPCTATGVIRRHPDIKHLRRASDLETLAARQRELLDALWPLLAAGGRLLYATCSVLAAENDGVVGAFVAATADVREDDVLPNNNIRDLMRRKACGYQLLPGTAGADGFYYACLEKAT